MSYSNVSNVKVVDAYLVDRILEQGQKLRNAMIGSIIKNDPFCTEINYNKHFSTPETSRTDINETKLAENLTSLDEKRLDAFIKGDCMTREDEKLALDTMRTLSVPDLCKTTERNLKTTQLGSCKCYTCEAYNSSYLKCDSQQKTNIEYDDRIRPDCSLQDNEITRNIQMKYKTSNTDFLKHVDSLKISINNLVLNDAGNNKVLSFFRDKNVPYSFDQNYFLEYKVPDDLAHIRKLKNKQHSELEHYNVRLCSRKNNENIYFKHVTIHDIKNVDTINLNYCDIQFKISYRNARQKKADLLGYATFNFGEFLLTKNLTCSRGLSVFLGDNIPIVVGTLKVSLQLGCGRLYFGPEFVDAINSSKKVSVILDSDDSTSQLTSGKPVHKEAPHYGDLGSSLQPQKKAPQKQCAPLATNRSTLQNNIKLPTDNTVERKIQIKKVDIKRLQPHQKPSSYFGNISPPVDYTEKEKCTLAHQIKDNEKQILFGFLYISEARYLGRPVNSYIACRPFCQSETSNSKLITDSSNPEFNFYQLLPLIFDDDFLLRLRENYMLVEFWEKVESTECVIGLTKIPLHQFYLAYRNPVILKYLCKNKLPVIGTDWWEPIYTVSKEKILGQVLVLIALGTEEQINNLKADRGFASGFVRAKFSEPKQTSVKEKDNFLSYKPKLRFEDDISKKLKTVRSCDRATNTDLNLAEQSPKKSNVSTQSNLNMEQTVEKEDKIQLTQEMLSSVLSQLVTEKQKNICVENSTNTDTLFEKKSDDKDLQQARSKTNGELRKTTDLLNSLQTALSVGTSDKYTGSTKKPVSFKANVKINSANHLPSRKKCKSRKSRQRAIKNEENILPSSYVSFETLSETDLKITPVVLKSSSPTWNYNCDVNLPLDLLINKQKRLIFKVWRKSTNNITIPNMQSDIVLGFAAVDLTVLLTGFPNVQGWFNIVDFSGKCNGQINIHVTPLENLKKFSTEKDQYDCVVPSSKLSPENHQFSVANEPSEMLSRALKRKFSELDEITQRLRLRLSEVTNEGSDGSSDDYAEEFEKDINTLCVEEDFDLINFQVEAGKSDPNPQKNVESSDTSHSFLTSDKYYPIDAMQVEENKESGGSCSSSSVDVNSDKVESVKNAFTQSLDKQLVEGKQQISALLEKLSLLSADVGNPFTSRYVSGCSISNENNSNTNIDTEAILKELDHCSRPNIHSSLGFNSTNFQQLYGGSIHTDSSGVNSIPQSSNSDTSLITNFTDHRLEPDGQGNTSDEKIIKIIE